MNNIKILEKYLLLICVFCGLVFTASYSFAYYSLKVEADINNLNVDVNTASVPNIIYDAGQALNIGNLHPGDSSTKTFSIEFTPNRDIKSIDFIIDLNITSNTFSKCDSKTADNNCIVGASELVYKLYRQIGDGEFIELKPEEDITGFVGTKSIEDTISGDTGKVVYKYKLEIKFVNTNAEQNHNIDKSIEGNIAVRFADN